MRQALRQWSAPDKQATAEHTEDETGRGDHQGSLQPPASFICTLRLLNLSRALSHLRAGQSTQLIVLEPCRKLRLHRRLMAAVSMASITARRNSSIDG